MKLDPLDRDSPNLHAPVASHRKPVVLIPCDNRLVDGVPMQVLYQRYSDAVRDQAHCLPIPMPCTGNENIDAYLAIADGIMLPGSPSNVHPSHFGADVHNPELPLDPARDAITLPLIRRVIALGMPVLAICRGIQEINVALGGSLHQAVEEVDGRQDHRGAQGREDAEAHERYADAHPIRIEGGGCLAAILSTDEVMVNSVHGQGIDRVADALHVEAVAPDGQVEAVSIPSHPGFSLGVQWHPEWQPEKNDVSMRLFGAFGDACRAWHARKGA